MLTVLPCSVTRCCVRIAADRDPPLPAAALVALLRPTCRLTAARLTALRRAGQRWRVIERERGQFRPDGTGWEGSHVGHFYGGATIQGLLAFFFLFLHPSWGHAEDHCTVNAQVASPFVQGPREGVCLDGTQNCSDCRETPVENIRHAHFTICQKPWICQEHPDDGPADRRLCLKLHKAWFDTRRELEQTELRTWPNESRYNPARLVPLPAQPDEEPERAVAVSREVRARGQ
eukprot:gene46895-47079_t